MTGHGSCLGLGPSKYSVKYPTLIPPTLFGRNEFNQTNKVKSIAAGYFYAAAITSDGQLYSWGENATGCLGIGSSNHQFFPFRVSREFLVSYLGERSSSSTFVQQLI